MKRTKAHAFILYVFLAFDKVLPPRLPLDVPYLSPISILQNAENQQFVYL